MTATSQSMRVGTGSVEDQLDAALQSANIPTLIAVLAHLTGDDKWLHQPYAPERARGLDDNDTGGLPEDIQDEIREAIKVVTKQHASGALSPKETTPERVAEILSAVLHEHVPSEYGPLLSEELGIISRSVPLTTPAPGFIVGIIGAGMSGIAAARELDASGVEYEILEKNDGVGGTWLENVYPGCGVDTPSSLYSYSFAPKRDWSRYFAKRDEVGEYFQNIAESSDIVKNVTFGTEVSSATWDDHARVWEVTATTADGRRITRSYNALISAVGQVNRPSIPEIEGSDTFTGLALHTAAWDPSIDVTGKRVVVIGTGASSMQLVPAVADTARELTIFQRSRHWALPHPNYQRELGEGVKLANDLIPFYTRWYRLRAFWNFGDRLHDSLRIDPDWEHPERSINQTNDNHRRFLTEYIKEQLGDRQDLLDLTLPTYPPYTKRPLLDNGWYRTLTRDNVHLVESRVVRITPTGVVDAEGIEYAADIVVYATGFKIQQFLYPMDVHGRSGRSLVETWGPDDARAYLGVTVPDFPNLFLLNGPNTFAGHGGSAILATEFQLRYALQGIERLTSGEATSVEVRAEVCDDYNKRVDALMDQMIWSHKGTTSYFRNKAGRVIVNSPWKYIDYWRASLEYNPSEYVETR
ncbi:NAD(P)/FAD-dependent oxidoreductase [Gordonia McavH-238-E]|uniref:flavin-containing monooxygenase n=1 Tax=Gordonia sp. McavH-238-E TaxID=2917736 RepID=UPI001EF54723|nr:NAD(P)/FAD-dependent oxidoreductase [Gordonia sp. McavH-238-E]MCG7632814.1 NAD(P)/FAD-dependent oxidoreductase [Gordonia sp. McavH-238-E]